jgi:hypothetical protein
VRSRAIILGQHYRASLDRESVRPGSKTARAVGRITRELADAERLPGSLDVQGLAPVEDDVMEWAHARQVPRTSGLLLWYKADASTLELVAVWRRPR